MKERECACVANFSPSGQVVGPGDAQPPRDATEMDLDRITRPLRLAKGSHRPGSGDGCAMNTICCSARPLAILVQSCNDLLAGPDGYYLSPENSLLALELGWQTVGTADVADTVIHAWVAELLTKPTWGVVRYAKLPAGDAGRGDR